MAKRITLSSTMTGGERPTCPYQKNAAMPVILVTGVAGETGIEFDAATEEEKSWIKADVLLSKPIRAEQVLGELTRLIKG